MEHREIHKIPVGIKKQGKNCSNPAECSPSTLDEAVSELTCEQVLDIAFKSYRQGDFSEVEKLARVVLSKAPCHPDALQLLAAVFNRKGSYSEAISLLRRAVREKPGQAHLHNNLAKGLHRAGKTREAVSQLKKAIELRPNFPKAYNNLAAALMELGDIDGAVAACRQAIRLRNDFKQAYNNLGLAYKRKGQLQKAVSSYRKAIEIDPQYDKALSNLSMLQVARDNLEAAADNARRAVSLRPDSPELHSNLGLVYNRQGRFEKALQESRKAITLSPDYVQAYNNLGTALMELGRFSEADEAFEMAISIRPDCAQAHHNRALVLLLRGRFQKGWAEYEWRWKNECFSTPLRPFPHKWWDGTEKVPGKLLIWAEQGIGDEVQFAGLIRRITERGIEVIIECDGRLAPLLRRSFPGTVVVERTNPPSSLLEGRSITHQLPMASIPGVLGLAPDSVPMYFGIEKLFIRPDKNKRERFRREYKNKTGKLLVGISWRSGNRQEGKKRSVDLEKWGLILNVEGTRFVNLQYGDCASELREVCNRFDVEIVDDERVDPLKDLEDFAAQMAAMDLVISVDNSTVHFAGAIGLQVWTLLPSVPDWRWMTGTDRSFWYPTMRLFRQAQRKKWEPVISQVAEKLASLVRADKS